MLTVDSSGFNHLLEQLSEVEKKHLPFVTAITLTKTAQEIREESNQMIDKVFDRPTRYTQNSTWYKPANYKDQTIAAAVWIKDETTKGTPAAEYLLPHIWGKSRVAKRSEKAMRARGLLKANQFIMPSKYAKLDRFGNIPRSQIIKMMSNIGGHRDRLQDSTNSKKSKRNRAKIKYFLFENADGSASGIWQRIGDGLKPFILFTDKAPNYKKRFPFFEMTNRMLNKRLGPNFNDAMSRALLKDMNRKSR